ncbi:PREDICTED: RE1-silencing transcription factor-like [Nicrophorus vespilloides]|uniref:RE1-silencing transcription factor-like n=1 Tax=Nicrophorus vespilloides TaxID=110193 RepID=A0ABM1N9J2_NICVS|nr:PREDICTED: RE1-silencing transcription factor-like [Nicrophorus vespilloides]
MISDDGGFTCLRCKAAFTRNDNLQRHLRFVCGVEPQFRCDFCAYSAKRKEALSRHLRSAADALFKSSVPRNLDLSYYISSEGRYCCPQCPDKVYKNKRNLKRHLCQMAYVSSLCHLCGVLMDTKVNLVIHMNTVHSTSHPKLWDLCPFRPFKCTRCKGYLERPFRCGNCTKSYKHRHNLRRHSKYECDGISRFVCHLCSKAYTQKSSLKQHIMMTHSQEAASCIY